MSTTKITIAVDGFAACGKSTLAKSLAKELNYIYIDSGAMYRAVTLFFLDQGITIDQQDLMVKSLSLIDISFKNINGQNRTFLNGKDVEEQIRAMRVSNYVSPVSTVSVVRRFLVDCQQKMGQHKGIVMDGRDIGTVVFQDAELKLFMTASIEVRTNRRLLELQSKGIFEYNSAEVEKNLTERDHIDSTRSDSPLKKAEDAIVIDNSNLLPKEQLTLALDLALKAISQKKEKLQEVSIDK